VTVRPVRCHIAESWPLSVTAQAEEDIKAMSAQELWKTPTMRYRRQQICSALFGYGRIVSREPMTTEHRLIPRNAPMLKNIASELAFGGGDDELEASRRLEGIAYGPSDRLSETFDFAQKGLQPS
jgi:hypothetical protein